MRKARLLIRTLATVATGLGLLLFTGAWSTRVSGIPLGSRQMAAVLGHGHASMDTYKTFETFWWNSGSCHGYPDVIQYYEVFRDENGTLLEYRDAGYTSGTDSCNIYHEGTFYDDPDYLDCPNCEIVPNGAVQGSTTGTTTGHPE